MHRTTFTICLASFSLAAVAQTITSVQDGAWTDPAVWDCVCVPSLTSDVQVLHHVTFGSGLSFGPSLLIAPGGHLEKIGPGYVQCLQPCSLHVEGLFSALYYMGLGVPVVLSGSIVAPGVYFAGDVQMTGGTVEVTGNFTTAAGITVDGYGQICAGDSTNIQGPLTGTIDICDQTPTTMNPPFVDGGSSFVGPGITFCQGTACSSSVTPMLDPSDVTVLTVGGAYVINAPVEDAVLTDISGRRCAVRTTIADGTVVVEPRTEASGIYVLSFRLANAWRSLRLVRE